MILKVKHGELKNIADVIKLDGNKLDDEVDELLKKLEVLESIWQGQDSTMFCSNVHAYLDKMKTLPVAMRNISTFIAKTDTNYAEHDAAFARELKSEAENYE
jgi:WXG100 family type VII secretion target